MLHSDNPRYSGFGAAVVTGRDRDDDRNAGMGSRQGKNGSALMSDAGDTWLSTHGEGAETQQLALPGQPLLTTGDGMPIRDNQNSLRTAPRGFTVLDDQVYLDKITHFDRERIPERVVNARGAGAHGYFELAHSLAPYTTAKVLTEVGVRVPVFARFSTVAGAAGSADTVRDVRGFAVKFYTSEGNWDLVGNSIPVFFIQDAMKFPDLVHALKPEPDRGYPTASSAHDTFWDFVSLMPETMHMLLWVMSDRALPRSFAMMEGFGVHTFRLIDARGQSTFVKYHWRPVAGTQTLLWDEAVRIAGADPDYHRRDLRELIESGLYPAWDLAVQLFSEADAETFPFDILDATKLLPEEVVPLRVIGRMVLDANPSNVFAEVEQVAFCPSRIVPGMDLSNDPLLQGRALSYTDTQLHRLGGANFRQLPVNRPRCPVHHFQRDGHFQADVPAGRTAYEPNSLGPGTPRASAERGQRAHATVSHSGERGREREASFADHYTQARMFYRSLVEVEQRHVIDAFVFELSHVETVTIRERVVGHLRQVDDRLARAVSGGLGLGRLPEPAEVVVGPYDVDASPALSLHRKAAPTVKSRSVAILFSEGSDARTLIAVRAALELLGARVKLLAPKIGGAVLSDGTRCEADGCLDSAPSILFDAVVLLLTEKEARALSAHPKARAFVQDAFSHLKAIAHDAGGARLLEASGVERDPFVLPVTRLDEFIQCAGRRRFEREIGNRQAL